MAKSIQWTLQLWHAGLLATVLLAFGTVTFLGIRHAQYREVDAELERSVQLLAASIRLPPPPDEPPNELRGLGPFGMPGDREPAAGRGDSRDIFRRPFPGTQTAPADMFTRRPPPAGPLPDDRADDGFGRGGPSQDPGDGPPREGRRRDPRGRFHGPMPTPQVEIPTALGKSLGDDSSLYCVVWDRNAQVLRAWPQTTQTPYPEPRPDPDEFFPVPEPPRIRQRGDLREAFVGGPFGVKALVGRSVLGEQARMRSLAWLLIGSGGAVLGVGLLGGWVLSRRALRPIHAMTEAAQRISASNLARRLDVAETRSELGTLARVLNDTFSRLEAAFQQQVRFTADASHELRTPLSVIHTHAQLALSRDRSADDYRQTIETCLRASTRMKNLVDALLLLARADAGRLVLEKGPIDLREIVRECIEMTSSLAAERGVSIVEDIQAAELVGDATRLSQVVTNLLTNAIRYNREKGRVTVSLKLAADAAELRIADSGVGIPAESQPHLFERFFRVDKARSREDGGSGLGLAICRSIVEAHGGSITFHSEIDVGTTFCVRLPLAEQEPG